MKKEIGKISNLAERCMHKENDNGDYDLNNPLNNANDDNISFNDEQGLYNPLDLVKIQNELKVLILNSDIPYSEILKIFSHMLKNFFKARYVEFLTVEWDHLRYDYINVPWFLSYTLHKLTGITAVEGLKIPLFKGSFFKKFIDEAVPREIISYEDRLKSFRDFVSPDTPKNRFLRNVIAPRLMPMFNYNYVFQIPLINNSKVIGYFSFLQNGRMTDRVRADIILISTQIASLISIRKEAEQKIIFLNSLPYPTVKLGVETDSSGTLAQCFIPDCINSAFEKEFKLKGSNLISRDVADLTFFKDNPEFINYFNEVFYTGIPVSFEFEIFSRFFKAIATKSGQTELLLTMEDITQQKKAEFEIREMASHDSLTGALNRRFFMTILNRELILMKRENRNCSLFFLDLNHFKEVNDTFGHDAGDAVIQHAVNSLREILRESDYICRQGGDEFIILCRETDRFGAEAIAEKIKTIYSEKPVMFGDELYYISTSMGISLYPEHGLDAEDLISAADRAMYSSKKNSLDYCIYNKND